MNLHAAWLFYAGCSAGLLLVDQCRLGLYLVKKEVESVLKSRQIHYIAKSIGSPPSNEQV